MTWKIVQWFTIDQIRKKKHAENENIPEFVVSIAGNGTFQI